MNILPSRRPKYNYAENNHERICKQKVNLRINIHEYRLNMCTKMVSKHDKNHLISNRTDAQWLHSKQKLKAIIRMPLNSHPFPMVDIFFFRMLRPRYNRT